jgi:hypothetical protein
MVVLEFKKREMEQQVEILRLDKDLGAAGHQLGEMHRAGYHTVTTRQTNKLNARRHMSVFGSSFVPLNFFYGGLLPGVSVTGNNRKV